MNKSLFLFLVAIAMTSTSALAQANLDQQNSSYSNVPADTQSSAVPAEAIQPYEVTLDDLSDTPWDEAKVTGTLERGATYRKLKELSITLKRGQDLIIHVKNVSCVAGDEYSGFAFDNQDKNYQNKLGGLYLWKTEVNWGGWDNFINRNTSLVLTQDEDVTSGIFYFKNAHSGKSAIDFLYTIIPTLKEPWLSEPTNYINASFNNKNVIVTCQ